MNRNKFFWCFVVAVLILAAISVCRNQMRFHSQNKPYTVIIRGKEIKIPAEYREINYKTGQFHSSIYFRVNVDDFKPIYDDPALNKSVASVLLVDDFAGHSDAKKFIDNLIVNEAGTKTADCRKVVIKNNEMKVCEYTADNKMHVKIYVIDNLDSDQNKTIIKCDMRDSDALPNPLCVANGVIFGDTRLHYSFSTLQMRNISQIDSGIRDIFKKAYAKNEGEKQ